MSSAQRQTLADIEILICDDASTDTTRDVVRKHQDYDRRIRLLCLSKNEGAGAARNLGMRAAKGDYIAFLDSDDEWMPDKLDRQIKKMDASTPDKGVCMCGSYIIKNGNRDRPVIYKPDKAWEHDTFRKFVLEKVPFLTPTILFRRSCLEKTGLMVPAMRRNQDREFLLRLFSLYKLVVINEPYVIINLDLASQNRHYEALHSAFPYRLRHFDFIKNELGVWTATVYKCLLYRNLINSAIRERKWQEAWCNMRNRLHTFPMLWPKDMMILAKSLIVALLSLNKPGRNSS